MLEYMYPPRRRDRCCSGKVQRKQGGEKRMMMTKLGQLCMDPLDGSNKRVSKKNNAAINAPSS